MDVNRIFLNTAKNTIAAGLSFAPETVKTYYKRLTEKLFWQKTLRQGGGSYYNGHMEKAFTDVFHIDKNFFTGKRILDIGCGPVGTLEWADNALERVGADPLANDYVKLNKGVQSMNYVRANAESLPFPDENFDVVSIFNALDHVEDVDAAIRDACRVVRTDGTILLIVEIDHKAHDYRTTQHRWEYH